MRLELNAGLFGFLRLSRAGTHWCFSSRCRMPWIGGGSVSTVKGGELRVKSCYFLLPDRNAPYDGAELCLKSHGVSTGFAAYSLVK